MRLKCKLTGHARTDAIVYNSGFFFARCGHCRTDLIRTGTGGWQDVPEGHAVAWKAGGRHSHSLPADFTGLLPVAIEETRPRPQLPATRDRFFSWSRALVTRTPRHRRLKRGSGEANNTAISEEIEEKPLPVLLIAALVFGASMRLLVRPRRR